MPIMKTDAIGRKLRYNRPHKKTPFKIVDTDLEILKLLSRYRYLRKDFICEFVGRSPKKVAERLRILYDNNVVERPPQQWQAHNARYSNIIYELAEEGESVLKEHDLYPQNVSRLTKNGRQGRIRQFSHSMMICDTLASIELGCIKEGLNFISWEEILVRNGTLGKTNPFRLPSDISYHFKDTGSTHYFRGSFTPDGIFGIQYPNGNVSFFALEAERGNGIRRTNLDQTSFLKKVLQYQYIVSQKLYKEILGVPNLRVLVVTTNETRVDNMLEVVNEVYPNGSNIFLLHDIPTQDYDLKAPNPFPELISSDWKRANRENIKLSVY